MYKDKYDIIEIEAVNCINIIQERLKLIEFLKKIRINSGIKDKFVVFRTSNVKYYLFIYIQSKILEEAFEYDLDAVNDPTCGALDPKILELISQTQTTFITNLNPCSDSSSEEAFNAGQQKIKSLLKKYNIIE